MARGGWHPLSAVLYVVVPASIISLDRMLVDLPLTSLALGFAVYLDPESPWKLYVILAAIAAERDSGQNDVQFPGRLRIEIDREAKRERRQGKVHQHTVQRNNGSRDHDVQHGEQRMPAGAHHQLRQPVGAQSQIG